MNVKFWTKPPLLWDNISLRNDNMINLIADVLYQIDNIINIVN
jgi:hypothetical protein